VTIILRPDHRAASLIGGFAALGGKVSVLWQPWELVIILGVAAIGRIIVANPMKSYRDDPVAFPTRCEMRPRPNGTTWMFWRCSMA
jgi:chemotaxis protein MotA